MTEPSSAITESDAAWRHAFRLLAAVELGQPPPLERLPLKDLHARVASLVVLFDIVPRSESHRLPLVLNAWKSLPVDDGRHSLQRLRDTARAALRLANAPGVDGEQEDKTLERATRLLHLQGKGRVHDYSAGLVTDGTDAEAQQLCVYGLKTWLDQLTDSHRWKYLPAMVPGEAPAPFEQIYVDLYAIPEDDLAVADPTEGEGAPRLGRRPRPGKYPAVSATALISRTLERCIIVGEPGSGKSTLIHWLAWSVERGRLPDFDLPLVVKLSTYAKALEHDPSQSLLEFFFQSLGTQITSWRPAAVWLRTVAAVHGRFLLLLDGWDEVPASLRELVREHMAVEEKIFTTVVTSRPSGMPQQLRPGTRVDYYHIAGLTESAQNRLIGRLLGSLNQSGLRDAILQQIHDESDLREMADNPFLLGLLVRVLARNLDGTARPRTRAEVYQQVLSWMREQHNRTVEHHLALHRSHVVGLQRLSYQLLFDAGPPKYVFTMADLVSAVPDGADAAVLRSRFVNRLDLLFDEHAFVHATIQEYLAAEHLATRHESEFIEDLDRTFYSASRLIVLEFLAGLGGQVGPLCRDRVVHWLKNCDRFHQVLLRTARLAAAGRWMDGSGVELDQLVRKELWQIIQSEEDMGLTRAAVEAFADLDAADLCRRARRESTISTWAINCLIVAVPASIARTEGIDDLLDGKWKDYAGFDVRGGATCEELTAVRTALANVSLAAEDMREAIVLAGAARDEQAVPLLRRKLLDPDTPAATREQAIDSLGLIGGQAAHDVLVEIVLGDMAANASERHFAAAALRHTPGSGKSLEPAGRDRLLRRLSTLPADHPYVEQILAALDGFPIRDGSVVVAGLAQDQKLKSTTRCNAIVVLGSIPDRRFAYELIGTIGLETSPDVIGHLLNLAVLRAIPVPCAWLSQKIQHCRDRVQLHRLMRALIYLWPYQGISDQEAAGQFLHTQIVKSLQANPDGGDDRSKALVQALSLSSAGSRPILREETLQLAQLTLVRYAEFPHEVPEGSALLATAILSHFRRPSLHITVRAALETALDRLQHNEQTEKSAERIAQALAKCLGDIAPGDLLSFPASVAIVKSVLRSFATERGWLVFQHRIINAEGIDVTATKVEVQAMQAGEFSPEVQRVMSRLSSSLQKTLASYFLMVMPGGPCRPDNHQDTIYEAIRSLHEGETESPLAAKIDQLFPNALPTFSTWRSNLSRIERKVRDLTENRDLLRHYGLFRRTRRNGGQ